MEGVSPGCGPGAREEQAAGGGVGVGRGKGGDSVNELQKRTAGGAHMNVPYVRYRHEGRGPHRPTMRVRHRQVVAGGAVGVDTELQAHVHADKAL